MPNPDLASQQAALARALTGAGPPPPGFDPARLSLAAQTLLAKRASSAAKSWPDLAHSLGPDFFPLFTSYAESHPLPENASPLADAHAFAQSLYSQRLLPPRATRLLCLSDLRTRHLSWRTTTHPWTLTLALRLPLLGTRVLTFPAYSRKAPRATADNTSTPSPYTPHSPTPPAPATPPRSSPPA